MSDRQQHWEQIYHDKSPLEVSWYQKEPTLSLQMIQHCRIAHTDAIIDVGGGASILVDKLLTQGYQRLAVLDISSNALQVARQRLGARAQDVEWFVSDITEFSSPHTFMIWHDRAVFHFLTDASDRKKYLHALRTALPTGAYLILAAFAIDGPTRCSGLEIVQYDREKICQELGTEFELLEEADETHLTPSGGEQRFGYYRFILN